MEKPSVKNTKSVGGVVINQQGEVLVISQHGTAWSLPKGHIDEGETEIEAAKREITEESGISQLKFVRKLGSYQRHRINPDGNEDQSEFKTITIFLFKTDENLLKPLDPDNPEARWIPKEKVTELLTHPKDKEYFLSILKEI